MSTNFYFVNRKSAKETEEHNIKVGKLFMEFNEKLEKLVGDHNDHISILNCEPDFLKEPERIHIGKRSMGWKPLFEASKHFSSMKEMMEWYKSNASEYTIENEYGNELTWTELEKDLMVLAAGSSKSHLSQNGYYADEYGYEWTKQEFF